MSSPCSRYSHISHMFQVLPYISHVPGTPIYLTCSRYSHISHMFQVLPYISHVPGTPIYLTCSRYSHISHMFQVLPYISHVPGTPIYLTCSSIVGLLTSVSISLKLSLLRFSNLCICKRMLEWFCSSPVKAFANALYRQFPSPTTV